MKSFVVTGGNKGIGLAVVKRILQEIDNSFVFLCSRNLERGQTAIDSLVQENASFKERTMLVQLDVSSSESLKSASSEIEVFLNNNQDKSPIEGLVNNAGVATESIKTNLDINVRAVKHFSDYMIPLMSKTGRIVHMGSGSAPMFVAKCNEAGQKFFKNPNITWEDLSDIMNKYTEDIEGEKETHIEEFGLNLKIFSKYGFSKALLHSLTMVQARDHPSMSINACSPGWIMTDMTLKNSSPSELEKAKARGMKTPFEGGNSTLFLLTSSSLAGNGWYYGSDCKRSPLHKYRSPGDAEYDGSDD